MRPRLFYAVFSMGQVIAIAHGRAEAKAFGTGSFKGFRTRLQAEEFAAWWDHEHPPWWRFSAAPRHKPL